MRLIKVSSLEKTKIIREEEPRAIQTTLAYRRCHKVNRGDGRLHKSTADHPAKGVVATCRDL